jgi:hypothetical protein
MTKVSANPRLVARRIARSRGGRGARIVMGMSFPSRSRHRRLKPERRCALGSPVAWKRLAALAHAPFGFAVLRPSRP